MFGTGPCWNLSIIILMFLNKFSYFVTLSFPASESENNFSLFLVRLAFSTFEVLSVMSIALSNKPPKLADNSFHACTFLSQKAALSELIFFWVSAYLPWISWNSSTTMSAAFITRFVFEITLLIVLVSPSIFSPNFDSHSESIPASSKASSGSSKILGNSFNRDFVEADNSSTTLILDCRGPWIILEIVILVAANCFPISFALVYIFSPLTATWCDLFITSPNWEAILLTVELRTSKSMSRSKIILAIFSVPHLISLISDIESNSAFDISLNVFASYLFPSKILLNLPFMFPVAFLKPCISPIRSPMASAKVSIFVNITFPTLFSFTTNDLIYL